MTESANICRSLDKREYVTNHSFNCKGKCSKYLFICVKSTSANCKRFGLIWNSEWESDSFLDGVSFIFVDKTDPIDPNKQKLYWRQTLKLRVSRMTVKPIFYMFYARLSERFICSMQFIYSIYQDYSFREMIYGNDTWYLFFKLNDTVLYF